MNKFSTFILYTLCILVIHLLGNLHVSTNPGIKELQQSVVNLTSQVQLLESKLDSLSIKTNSGLTLLDEKVESKEPTLYEGDSFINKLYQLQEFEIVLRYFNFVNDLEKTTNYTLFVYDQGNLSTKLNETEVTFILLDPKKEYGVKETGGIRCTIDDDGASNRYFSGKQLDIFDGVINCTEEKIVKGKVVVYKVPKFESTVNKLLKNHISDHLVSVSK